MLSLTCISHPHQWCLLTILLNVLNLAISPASISPRPVQAPLFLDKTSAHFQLWLPTFFSKHSKKPLLSFLQHESYHTFAHSKTSNDSPGHLKIKSKIPKASAIFGNKIQVQHKWPSTSTNIAHKLAINWPSAPAQTVPAQKPHRPPPPPPGL